MFKRKLEIRLAKDTRTNAPTDLITKETASNFTNMVKDTALILGVGTILVICAGVAANALGEIAVHKFTQ